MHNAGLAYLTMTESPLFMYIAGILSGVILMCGIIFLIIGLDKGDKKMSCSKWNYSPKKCDGDYCPGECDDCPKLYADEEEDEEPTEEEPQKGRMTVPANIVGHIVDGLISTVAWHVETFPQDDGTCIVEWETKQ